MLKITYSNSGLGLEHIATTVEAVVAQRSVLALRLGQPIVVQPSYGSFLLPSHLPGVTILQEPAVPMAILAITPCDRDWLEVTLRGTWIADAPTSEQGMLVAELAADLERQLVTLWRCSQTWVATDQRLPKAC
jgi:hypothetical protein